MAAIIKANSSLSSGNLSVLRRSFTTSDTGQMTYIVEYCCLAEFASRNTPLFKSGSQPPTRLPANMLLLRLNKTPTLLDLETWTQNGLTYYRATYSAGVETDVIITEESDIRTHSYSKTVDVGFYTVGSEAFGSGGTFFNKTGEEIRTESFNYTSVTVSASAKNAELPAVQGYTLGVPGRFSTTTLVTTSKTRNSRGEFTYTRRSTGVVVGSGI